MTIGIHQLLPSLEKEDAIGDYARRLRCFLREEGFDSRIFAYRAGPGNGSLPYREHRRFSSPDNILIFHTAIGSPLADYFRDCPDKLVLVHHNVTPARFFAPWEPKTAYLAHQARRQLTKLAGSVRLTIADSPFNARELEELGFPEPVVIPLIFETDRLEGEADRKIMEKYGDGRTNLLFVGRVAPNKKQEDLLRTFHSYRKAFNPDSRLFLVGELESFPAYTKSLINTARDLGLEEVVFTGKVSPAELRAYYRTASLFLSMSEHEGFGVPLLEAIFHRLPIIAFAGAAVPETLGGAGVLLSEKRPEETAALIHRLLSDPDLREKVLRSQDQRLAYFTNFPYREKWEEAISRLL